MHRRIQHKGQNQHNTPMLRDRYGASMFLHYQRGFNVEFEGVGANNYWSNPYPLKHKGA